MFKSATARLVTVFSLLFVCLLCQTTKVIAEPRFDKFGGLIHRGAEQKKGVIDAIRFSQDGVRLIIDDTEYRLGKNVKLYSSYGNRVSVHILKDGEPVIFYAVNDLISNMWPDIAPDPEELRGHVGQQVKPGPLKSNGLHLEGNTWKN